MKNNGYLDYCARSARTSPIFTGEALVILLGGGTKKHQQRDIDAAKIYWKDYKIRKQGNG